MFPFASPPGKRTSVVSLSTRAADALTAPKGVQVEPLSAEYCHGPTAATTATPLRWAVSTSVMAFGAATRDATLTAGPSAPSVIGARSMGPPPRMGEVLVLATTETSKP